MRSLIFLLLLSFNATAALYDRGNGLIYDDVLDITWLQDANYAYTSDYVQADSYGRMTWGVAKAWAAQLSYGGYDDWRLPSANLMNAANPCQAYDGSCDSGYNNTTSELGHMFYNNLGNLGSRDTNGNVQSWSYVTSWFTDGATSDVVSIHNLQKTQLYDINYDVYWFGEEYAPNTGNAWAFLSFLGYQGTRDKHSFRSYSWAVRDGDVSSVPLPAGIYLFLSGLVSLGLMRGRNV